MPLEVNIQVMRILGGQRSVFIAFRARGFSPQALETGVVALRRVPRSTALFLLHKWAPLRRTNSCTCARATCCAPPNQSSVLTEVLRIEREAAHDPPS